MIGLFAFAAAAAAVAVPATTYDCSMEVPKAISRSGSTATVAEIGLPDVSPEDWHFALTLDKGAREKGIDATIVWPKNPLQMAGKFAALVTADGSLAFSTFSAGPCVFMESMCMALVNMVRQPDGRIKFVVLPAALATDQKSNSREPFIVVAEGFCTEGAK